jgi:6-phosphogluconolactonase
MTVARWLKAARRVVLGSLAVLATMGGAGAYSDDDFAPSPLVPNSYWVYVGSYTTGKTPSEGIYRFEFNTETGKLTPKGLAAKLKNPTFLARHPARSFLYAVNEVEAVDGVKGGAVTAMAVDAESGVIKVLNHQSTKGAGPCHLKVDAKGMNVLAANYNDGSVVCLPLDVDGSLEPASAFIKHEGKGTDPGRQEKAHAHSVNLDFSNKHALVADLGLDKVFVYKFNAREGSLTPNDPPFASIEPGSGPRHLAWHPSTRYAYVINEMGNTVTVLTYDAQTGRLDPIQTISTLPEGFQGKSWTAEIAVHPNGDFVYGSNRGDDSIAIFEIHPTSGKLTAVGRQPTGGKTPRNFVIDRSGRWLLAANQDSNNIVVFRINRDTGALEQVGEPASAPMPVCIRMIPREVPDK